MIALLIYLIPVFEIIRRRPFTFAYSLFGLFVGLIAYAAFPISYNYRLTWIPAFEEALKAHCIYRFQKMKRLERMVTSAAFGVVDGLSQMPRSVKIVNEVAGILSMDDQFSAIELVVYPIALCWLVVFVHFILGALFLSPEKRNRFFFFVPPVIAHYTFNWLSHLNSSGQI